MNEPCVGLEVIVFFLSLTTICDEKYVFKILAFSRSLSA